jgi:hypothetical protein
MDRDIMHISLVLIGVQYEVQTRNIPKLRLVQGPNDENY